jgi:hypothetical protein
VVVESFVGLCYEPSIKSLLAAARLVPRDQKNRFAFRVEREGDALGCFTEPEKLRKPAGRT